MTKQKLAPLSDVVKQRKLFAGEGKRVVLTNGCFDLLHAGHIHLLEQARQLGDILIVAVNSDRSVRALKGPDRPVQDESQRAGALVKLDCTSLVFVFDQARLTAEIRLLRPEFYAKGADYSWETLEANERRALEEVRTEARFFPLLPGFSSTDLIRRAATAGGHARLQSPP